MFNAIKYNRNTKFLWYYSHSWLNNYHKNLLKTQNHLKDPYSGKAGQFFRICYDYFLALLKRSFLNCLKSGIITSYWFLWASCFIRLVYNSIFYLPFWTGLWSYITISAGYIFSEGESPKSKQRAALSTIEVGLFSSSFGLPFLQPSHLHSELQNCPLLKQSQYFKAH